MSSTFGPALTSLVPESDIGKTIADISNEEGHYYDILGRVITVNRATITYTDGSKTVMDLADGIRYSGTGFIAGRAKPSIVGYVQAIEANLTSTPDPAPEP